MVGGGSIFRAKLGIRSGPGALFLRCFIISVTLLKDMVISGSMTVVYIRERVNIGR